MTKNACAHCNKLTKRNVKTLSTCMTITAFAYHYANNWYFINIHSINTFINYKAKFRKECKPVAFHLYSFSSFCLLFSNVLRCPGSFHINLTILLFVIKNNFKEAVKGCHYFKNFDTQTRMDREDTCSDNDYISNAFYLCLWLPKARTESTLATSQRAGCT